MPGYEIFGDEERQQVRDVLATGVLSRYNFDTERCGHWKARSLESELTAYLGSKHCHVCSSGTAALSIALSACGVGVGDEVIVPPFTFIATIEAVLMVGAIPVFAEIDDTLCLNPVALEASIGRKTKAVLIVHMCGAMARIDAIKDFCDRNGLILIEDACQSFGASYQGRPLGTFGKMGCFSFDPVKTITCGEGGAIVTHDDTLYHKAHAFADHGHDHIGADRGAERHTILGCNYRISELNAAVGLAQLRKINHMLEIQRSNKSKLKSAIKHLKHVSFRCLPDEDGDSATFLTFMLPDEKTARKSNRLLKQAGVEGCFYWYDNNWHYLRGWKHLKQLSVASKLAMQINEAVPDYSKVQLPKSDAILSRTISIQIKLSWAPSSLDQIIGLVLKTLR